MVSKERPRVPQPLVLLTVEEAAERLRLCRTSIHTLIRTGELESLKIGKARRIPVTALDELIARRCDRARLEVAS